MKILTKQTILTILKVGFVTALIGSLLLMGVDLFKNMDTYIDCSFSFANILKLTFLYFPEAFLLSTGPAFLFSVTYFLSSLQANNELITLFNSGISFRKIIYPCLACALFIGVFYFGFNELIAIKTSNQKAVQFENMSYLGYGEIDNSSIFYHENNNYLLFSEQYMKSNKTLYNVSYVKFNQDHKVDKRVDSYKWKWNEESEKWVFHDSTVFEYDGNTVQKKYYETFEDEEFNLEPVFFEDSNTSINNLPLKRYKEYINKVKLLNPEKFSSVATDYYSRVLGCLTPVVLMIISCFSNIRFKKNILFFSILVSLCYAVVYYVVRILTVMMASQGMISPLLGIIIPFIAVIIIATIANRIFGTK